MENFVNFSTSFPLFLSLSLPDLLFANQHLLFRMQTPGCRGNLWGLHLYWTTVWFPITIPTCEGGGFFPHCPATLGTPASCPKIQPNSDTIYLEIASDPTG